MRPNRSISKLGIPTFAVYSCTLAALPALLTVAPVVALICGKSAARCIRYWARGRGDFARGRCEVLMVGQRLRDQPLQPRVPEDLRVGDRRKRSLTLFQIGVADWPRR